MVERSWSVLKRLKMDFEVQGMAGKGLSESNHGLTRVSKAK